MVIRFSRAVLQLLRFCQTSVFAVRTSEREMDTCIMLLITPWHASPMTRSRYTDTLLSRASDPSCNTQYHRKPNSINSSIPHSDHRNHADHRRAPRQHCLHGFSLACAHQASGRPLLQLHRAVSRRRLHLRLCHQLVRGLLQQAPGWPLLQLHRAVPRGRLHLRLFHQLVRGFFLQEALGWCHMRDQRRLRLWLHLRCCHEW